MKATTDSSTEPLLSSKVSYARNLSLTDDELKNFQSFLRLKFVDQSDAST
ncbi:hypothetical protein B296_00000848 [Ensete ventricosum]|uniref:Uncharacterized protein n=1 Tax=Ensete ventricosum TaxID=4639 RepID=A0A427AN73_ENSVE|nr:hypothetical protein B296_00000848 [Ensete ventricosum]